MATQTPTNPTLPCKECGYVNEPERVYCHNCGTKLDRSVLPKEEQMRREPADRVRKRIIRMTNPDTSKVKAAVITFVKVLIYAAMVAAVIAMVRPPTIVPGKAELSTRLVSSELSEAVNSPQPRALAFSQSDINAFLATGKVKKEGPVPGVEYRRTYLNLDPGVVRITLERSFWGYSLFFGTLYRVEANSGVLSATNVGGNIGQMPLHPVLAKYLDLLFFRDLSTALGREIGMVKQLQALRVEKERVTMVTRGAAR